MHCSTLLFAPWILTQNTHRTVIADAFIAITGNRITAIGKQQDATHITADTTIQLPNTLLMPGLVNAHTHIAMTFLRGVADDMPLMQWLTEHIFPVERNLCKEIVYLGALLGCAELTRTGTTTFCDMYLLEQAVYEATHHAGLRIRGGEVLFSFPSPAYATPEAALQLAEDHIVQWKDSDRIRPCIMPHSVYTANAEMLTKCAALARKYNVPVITHAAESLAETETSLQQHKKRPIAFLHDLGLLASTTTLAHTVAVNQEEIALLASTNTAVVHCPKSNLKLASGIAPIASMLNSAITPALGTDGPASNNSLNMFAEMNMCALIHKTQDPTALSAQTVLDMATVNGAKALHWQGIGSLEVGNLADIIALDLTQPNMQPMFTPASHAVYAASGHEVCFTMVGGEVLFANGEYTKIDYPLLCTEAKKLVRWVKENK